MPDARSDPPKPAKRRRLPRGGPSKPALRRLRDTLLQMRTLVLRSSRDLADEALRGSGQDASVDHMADSGSDNFEQDFSLALLEGEAEILQEIEAALTRLDGRGEYPFGVCETCFDEGDPWDPERAQPWIPIGRLDVLPYARLCVFHQEALEDS